MNRALPVRGAADLDRFLSAFPKNLQKNAYRQALRAAAAPIRDRARDLARKRSGKMAKAIKTGSPRQNQDGSFSVSIRLDGEHAFLGYFHEWGVAPHLISVQEDEKPSRTKRDGRIEPWSMKLINRAVREGSLRIGENFVGPTVMHPGMRASPFMRPALDMEADAAVQAFAAKIREFMEKGSGFVAPEAA
jgi:HK97 gp10 family phage protein